VPKIPAILPRGGKGFIGCDPGEEGALVFLKNAQDRIGFAIRLSNSTERDVWDWIGCALSLEPDIRGVIEQQTPRPTGFFDSTIGQWRQSILKSTCLLFGNYRMVRALFTAAKIPFEDCPPKRWQGALKIRPKVKGESDTDWKARLKARAQTEFPRAGIVKPTADAYLIAHYCRMQ